MFPEPSKWSHSLVHSATQSWGRLLIWQLSRRQSLTSFIRRVTHKHALPKKLAVHRVLYPSMLKVSWVEEKEAQPTERTAALWGLSSKIDSRIWVNFTRNGLRLGSRHQEPPHTDVSRNLATVVIRGVLHGLRRRRTGLLPSGPNSSFQMRASFVFHLETKVLESGGRVEKLIAQVAWSPVLRFHSRWWFRDQCHLLVLVHCVFLKTNVTTPVYQEILELFMFPSADQLFKDADFIFQHDLSPAHTAKSTKSWLNDRGVGVLDWPANYPDLNPKENLWGIVKRKMRNKRPKNADELKATVKETWASIPPQQCHKLITSMPRQIEAVIKAKGAPSMY